MQAASWFPPLVTTDDDDVVREEEAQAQAEAAAESAAFQSQATSSVDAAASSDSTNDRVDISLDPVRVPDLYDAVNAHIRNALHAWNALDHVAMDQMLAPRERKLKYRRLLRWLVYADDPSDPSDSSPTSRRAPEHETRRQLRRIVRAVPSIHQLRNERRPSARLESFLRANPVSGRVQNKTRSRKHTTTFGCFEFARTRSEHAEWMATHQQQQQQQLDDEDDLEVATNATRTRTGPGSGAGEPRAVAACTAHDGAAETILLVEVLHPSLHPKRTQWFLVLANQMLSDLVDVIACSMDLRLETSAKHSKLLFLGSRFFADLRSAQHMDLSPPIRHWLKQKPSRLQHWNMQQTIDLPTLCMETTRFCDLQTVEVDAANLYLHQGECEHVFFIRDVRLRHEQDTKDNQKFPLRLLQDENPEGNTRMIRTCLICQHFSAKFVCFGDLMSVADPMLFCEQCYQKAHYAPDGRLLYSDFKAFPYFQD